MIVIMCALHCEAKPLVDFFKLKLDREAKYPIFSRDEIVVAVAGAGKLLMASAVNYIYARYNEPQSIAWINLGVAGGGVGDVASLYNINKVTDAHSGVNWYPVRCPTLSYQSSISLLTLDSPETDYKENCLFDMEASAFLLAALRFSSIELIQLLKIVSDNKANHVDKVDKAMVTEIVQQNMAEIEKTVITMKEQLQFFKQNEWELAAFQYCLDNWHLSEYQKKSIKRLLQQWRVLDEDADIKALAQLPNGKGVINALEEMSQNLSIQFAGETTRQEI